LLATEPRAAAPYGLTQALPVLKSFVSPYTGIARNYVELLHGPDEGRLLTIGCALADGEPVLGVEITDHTGGCHWNPDVAVGAALGEAVERYSAAYIPEADVVTSSADELGPEAVDPTRFALFHENQYALPCFPFQRFESASRLRWVEGFSLPDGKRAYLPAQLVYLRPAVVGEALIGYSTSNGLACGPSLEDALLGGLFEVMERDAFMLTWYNRLSLPRLVWDSDPRLAALTERCFNPTGLRHSLIDLSTFFEVPTVLGVVWGPAGELGSLGVGAGCAATAQEACQKALSESFAVHRWARDMAIAEPDRRPSSSPHITSFDDHLLFYVEERNAKHAAFLDSSTERRDVEEIAPVEGLTASEQIESLARRLAARDATAYAVDVTAPDVRSSGLRVARVIVPELCGLDVVDTARLLGGRRMYFASYEAGLSQAPLSYGDLNPYPHPFP
jgi:ribosomal protein S12 methylthiotransferase accessory factor